MIGVETEYPIALDSDDHRFPRGTANDDTHCPAFVAACERIFGGKVRHLDLGCAGGGLVKDFLDAGHFSIGIEGSDYSRRVGRAQWPLISDALFTADITKPFRVRCGADALRFDVITAWEVLEHIREDRLLGLLKNIRRHLAPGGIFVASVATFPDQDYGLGAVWHQTIQSREWWESRVVGWLAVIPSPFTASEYVRGSGNGPDDWDAVRSPAAGFHITAIGDLI